jgi:small subunit ribosomal protein S3
MGQKIHPVGLRLGITRTWDSRWYEKKNYRAWLHEDAAIRKYFGRLTRAAAISKVEIERRANQARVIVHTAKPGIIIGKRGVGIEDIRRGLEHLTQKAVQVNVVEIKHPELDARLVGQNIVDQLEKRIAFRRAMKQAIMRTMKAGAKGVKVMVSGRLGGAEIARSEQNHDGKVPLHTLRADIDYAHVEAFTTFGRIGCKVWIYKGEVMPEGGTRPEARGERGADRTGFRDRRRERPARPRPAVTSSELGGVILSEAPEGSVILSEAPEGSVILSEALQSEASEAGESKGRAVEGQAAVAPVEAQPGLDLPTPAEIEHDHTSLASEIDGVPAIDNAHATGPHGGSVLHDQNAQHGSGVTTETSQVDVASQRTDDSAERSSVAEAERSDAPVTLSEAPADSVMVSGAGDAGEVEPQPGLGVEAPPEEPT